MSTALVLCGGSTHGAIEVGLYKAIEETGHSFDFIVGTSVGAINGALIAAGISAKELEHHWRSLSKSDFMNFRWWWWKLLRNKSSICTQKHLENFLRSVLPIQSFESLHHKLVVIATDLTYNQPVIIENGNLIEAILASCAIPGIYPPRFFQGKWLIDGAVSANSPVLIARNLGAKRIITFPCRCTSDAHSTPVSLMNIVLKSLAILIKTQDECHHNLVSADTELILIQNCPGKHVERFDFERAHELIDSAYERALEVLKHWQ